MEFTYPQIKFIDFTEEDLTVLVLWMIKICHEFNFSTNIFIQSVDILYKALSMRKRVKKKNLKMYGIISIFLISIARKYNTPSIDNYIYKCARAYLRDKVYSKILSVAKKLGCKLLEPSTTNIEENEQSFAKLTSSIPISMHLIPRFMFLPMRVKMEILSFFRTQDQNSLSSNSAGEIDFLLTKLQELCKKNKTNPYVSLIRNTKSMLKIHLGKFPQNLREYTYPKPVIYLNGNITSKILQTDYLGKGSLELLNVLKVQLKSLKNHEMPY